jgi:hypothetical protein
MSKEEVLYRAELEADFEEVSDDNLLDKVGAKLDPTAKQLAEKEIEEELLQQEFNTEEDYEDED